MIKKTLKKVMMSQTQTMKAQEPERISIDQTESNMSIINEEKKPKRVAVELQSQNSTISAFPNLSQPFLDSIDSEEEGKGDKNSKRSS